MTGKELHRMVNEALNDKTRERISDVELYFSEDEFLNYTLEEIEEMLEKHHEYEKTYLSLYKKDGTLGYYMEFSMPS